MIYPAILLVTAILFLVLLPFQENFAPQKLESVWDYKSNDSSSYVYTTVDELYYSGYNISRAFSSDYGYYYTIKDNRCLFVLIPVSSTPEETLENYKIYGHIVNTSEKDTFKDMVAYLAEDLNWNERGLQEITADYLISNADYYPLLYFILFVLLMICTIFALYLIAIDFIHYRNPASYPVCPRMDSKDTKRLITKAEKELKENVILNLDDLYLTEHYFIEFNNNKVVILPLMRVVWGYRMGTLNYKLRHKIAQYNLFFTLKSGDVIVISNKSSEQTQQMLEAIRQMNLGIILGYTDTKRKKAKELMKKQLFFTLFCTLKPVTNFRILQ